MLSSLAWAHLTVPCLPKMRHGKQLAYFIVSGLCILLLLMMFFNGEPTDVYLFQQSLSFTCYFYQTKMVSGNLCSQLCRGRNLYINRCLSCKTQYKVFTGQLGDINVLIKHLKTGEQPFDRESESKLPPEELETAISSYLRLKFGKSQLDELRDSLLRLADSDRNTHISPPEARAMLSLIKNNDFLMTVALADNEKVPNLIGHCGDIFVTEGLDSYELQLANDHWELFSSIPPWPDRVRIAVGLLEFVEDIQDQSFGNLLLCSLTTSDIGLVKDEATFYNLEWVASERQISEHLKYLPCKNSEDCTYGSSCSRHCNSSGRCVGNETLVNLPHACALLQSFLTYGAPKTFSPKIKELLGRCQAMDTTSKTVYLEHSVILSDLKNSLWEEIHLLWQGVARERAINTQGFKCKVTYQRRKLQYCIIITYCRTELTFTPQKVNSWKHLSFPYLFYRRCSAIIIRHPLMSWQLSQLGLQAMPLWLIPAPRTVVPQSMLCPHSVCSSLDH